METRTNVHPLEMQTGANSLTLNSDSWPLEPEINRLPHSVEDYYCAKFHVIVIGVFILLH